MIIVHPEILSFFEAVVDTLCPRRVDILYLNQVRMAYELLALQLDTTRRDGAGTSRMDAGVEERWRRKTELHTSGVKRAETSGPRVK